MKNRYMKITFLLLTAFFCFQGAMAKVWYVNSPTVSWQGKNAADVLSSLTDLVQADGDQVWLAAGTFSLDATFEITKKISVYGGFAGTESKIGDRKKVQGGKPWEFVNVTVLDGRSAKRVVNVTGSGVIVDGITIANGKTTGSNDNNDSGAGIHFKGGSGQFLNCIVKNCSSSKAGGGISIRASSGTIDNCLFTDNTTTASGGGVALYGGGNPVIKNSEVRNNKSTGGSGGIYVYAGTVESCIIEGNTGSKGGGLYLRSAGASNAYNCLIVNNQSTGEGGGVYCQTASNAGLFNCTVVNNVSKGNGGGLAYGDNPSAINVKNTIIWGNKKGSVLDQIGAVSGKNSTNSKMVYSAVQAESVSGSGNIALTQDSAVIWGSDWNLGALSPCVDAGTTEGITLTVDLAGRPRTIGASIDMGAYERILYPAANGVFYVNGTASGNASGASWANAFTEIQKGIDAALAYATETGKEATVWVAGGEYAVDEPVELKNGVSIFGGFAGTEQKLEERPVVVGGDPWEFIHPTVVKPATGKEIRAMYSLTRFTKATYVNGFTITGGYAKGSNDDAKSGGGIHVMNNTFVQNCIITGNRSTGNGGGISIRGAGLAGIENCLIEKNTTTANGGGVALYAMAEQVYIKNSKIINNETSSSGGGIFVFEGKVENCVITHNKAVNGGGIFSRQYPNSSSQYMNCLVAYNEATTKGGAIFCETAKEAKFYNLTVVANKVLASGSDAAIGYKVSPTGIEIINTIFWGNKKGESVDGLAANPMLTYSAADGTEAPAGEGNKVIQDSASFFGANWQLAESSPGKDAGKNLSELPGLDLAGALRVQNGTVDMGAYEAGILYSPDADGVVYVKAGAGTDHVGNSWQEAIGDINFAIEIARLYNTKISVGQKRAVVWVAGGEYNLTEAIVPVDGVSVYGGFAGTETTLEERTKGAAAWEYTNATVLKGSADRTYSVFEQQADFQLPVVIDGFTIQQGKTGASLAGNTTLQYCILQNNGHLDAAKGTEEGGGVVLKGESVVVNCLIENNTGKNGGGVAITAAGPVVRRCLIKGNTANAEGAGYGGGIYNTQGYVESCTFEGNTAVQGGGIFAGGDAAGFYNCILEGNEAAYGGGIAYGETTGASLYNLTVVGNTSTTAGGGVYFAKSGQRLVNTILWGNKNNAAAQEYAAADAQLPVIQNCAIQGTTETLPEGNNIALPTEREKIFDAGAWTLCEKSLCEDKGQQAEGLPETDFAGVKRIQGRTIDIGAYERPSNFYYHPSDAGILYVMAGQDGEGAAWDNALGDLQLALRLAAGYNDTVSFGRPKAQIWIAGGEYQLTEALTLVDGVNIYGGFAGTEADIEARTKGTESWEFANATVLKGNAGKTFNVIHQGADFKVMTIVDGVVAESGKSGTYLMKNLTLRNSVLRNNGVTNADGLGTADGGGIAAKNACIIENCLVENNTAKNGGGIAITAAGPVVRQCLIQNNTANGSGWGWGGGIFNNSGTVENCVVKNNTAEKGGGVFARKDPAAFYNCIVEGNRASYGGGVTYEARNNDAKNSTFYNFTIVNNVATTAGGGVYFAKTGQGIVNTILWGNLLNDAAEEYAAASGITLVIKNCAILAEAADLPEGNNVALTAESAAIFGENWTLAENSPCIDKGQEVEGLPEKDVYGNRRNSNGVNDIGACEYQKVLDYVADENGVFYVKNTGTPGKGNSWESPIGDLPTALKAAQTWQKEYNKVPQIWIAKGTYLLVEPINPVDGINIYGGFSGDKTETIEGRERREGSWDFVNETLFDAVSKGQCLVQTKDFSTVTIIDGLTLSKGRGLTGSNSHKSPGGAALKKKVYLQNCKILDCVNGGVFFTSDSKMSGCYLAGNTSLNDGGAVNFEFASIEDCVFENNYSEKDGGAASITYSGTAKNCIFRGNKAKGNGGAFKMHNGGTAINCLVEDNEAKKGGGFMFSGSKGSSYAKPATVINLTIVNNRATDRGGAFLAACMQPDCNLSIYNTAMWNNTGAGQPSNVTEPESPSTYTLENCFVMEGEVREGKDVNCITWQTDLTKEQIFKDNWELAITSPCIDAGKNGVEGSPDKDLAGNKRVSNGTVDIGVYEYQSLLDNFTIDYINETIALKGSDEPVECSAQLDVWETQPFSELITKEKRVIYCRAGGTTSELMIPGRGEPTARIDFAAEKLTDVAENSEWNINDAAVYEKIENTELTAYIGAENREFVVKQPATQTAFKTEKTYLLPARIEAPAFTLDYVTEELKGTAGTDMTLYEVSAGDAYTGLGSDAIITALVPKEADAATFTLSVRQKATDENFVSAVQKFDLKGRPAAPSYSIDFVAKKTKEVVPVTVEYDTVATFATKAAGKGELLELVPGKNYYFRVAASEELNNFMSVVFELEVPQIPQMDEITLDYQAEKLVGLPPYALWDYTGVTGAEAKEDITALVSESEDVELTIYVPVGENTFEGEARQIVLPKRPAAPDYIVDYADEKVVTRNEGITPGNWEIKADGEFEMLGEGGNISKYVPAAGEQEAVITLRSAAADGVFHSKEAVFIFAARPEKPDFAINYQEEKTTVVVVSDVEYSVYEDMEEVVLGGDTLLPLTPGVDLYFRYVAKENTFKSEKYHLVVPDRPSMNEVTIDFDAEKLNDLLPGSMWKVDDGEPAQAQADIRSVIPAVGAPDANMTIWVPATENSFSSVEVNLNIPARPATPVVTIDYEKEVLTGITTGMEWKKGTSEVYEPALTNIRQLIPAFGEAELTISGIRVAVSENNFKSGETSIVLKSRQEGIAGYSIDYVTEKTVEAVEAGIEYADNEEMAESRLGNNEQVTLEPGKTFYFRRAADNATQLFASLPFAMKVPERPVIVMEDMEKQLTDGTFTPKLWNSWNNTAKGILLSSSDENIAGVENQQITLKAEGECEITATMPANTDGLHFAAEPRIARLKVGMGTVVADAELPNLKIANGSMDMTFRIDKLGSVDKASLIFFNRTGKVIFESGNYGNNFDMGHLDPGTYYYVLTYQVNGETKVKKGFVEIIR